MVKQSHWKKDREPAWIDDDEDEEKRYAYMQNCLILLIWWNSCHDGIFGTDYIQILYRMSSIIVFQYKSIQGQKIQEHTQESGEKHTNRTIQIKVKAKVISVGIWIVMVHLHLSTVNDVSN